jgi:hypothetical protein
MCVLTADLREDIIATITDVRQLPSQIEGGLTLLSQWLEITVHVRFSS